MEVESAAPLSPVLRFHSAPLSVSLLRAAAAARGLHASSALLILADLSMVAAGGVEAGSQDLEDPMDSLREQFALLEP